MKNMDQPEIKVKRKSSKRKMTKREAALIEKHALLKWKNKQLEKKNKQLIKYLDKNGQNKLIKELRKEMEWLDLENQHLKIDLQSAKRKLLNISNESRVTWENGNIYVEEAKKEKR